MGPPSGSDRRQSGRIGQEASKAGVFQAPSSLISLTFALKAEYPPKNDPRQAPTQVRVFAGTPTTTASLIPLGAMGACVHYSLVSALPVFLPLS